jgi:hypothetical protein
MIRKRSYKGIEISELSTSGIPVEGTIAFGNRRVVFKGLVTIDKTKGSWKFGEQIQFVLWTKDPVRIEERADNDGYNRIEIALPLGMGKRMLKEAHENTTESDRQTTL